MQGFSSDIDPNMELTKTKMRALDGQCGIRVGGLDKDEPSAYVKEPWRRPRCTPRANTKRKPNHFTSGIKCYTENIDPINKRDPMQRPNARWPDDYE